MSHVREMTSLVSDVSLAPLRTFDDFLCGSARFELPQFDQKWNRRIVSNLIYYQTNYFLVSILIFLLIGWMSPKQMLLGIFAMFLASGVFVYAQNNSPRFTDFKKSHPLISLTLIFGGGYLFVFLFSSVLVFLMGILFPLFTMLVHASLRRRNLKNKVTNKMETIGVRRTPMGLLMASFGTENDDSFLY